MQFYQNLVNNIEMIISNLTFIPGHQIQDTREVVKLWVQKLMRHIIFLWSGNARHSHYVVLSQSSCINPYIQLLHDHDHQNLQRICQHCIYPDQICQLAPSVPSSAVGVTVVMDPFSDLEPSFEENFVEVKKSEGFNDTTLRWIKEDSLWYSTCNIKRSDI